MQDPTESPRREELSAFAAFLPKAVVLATALLVAPSFAATHAAADPRQPAAAAGKKAAPAAAKAKPARTAKAGKQPVRKADKKTLAKKDVAPQGPGPLADFGSAKASPEAVHVANWVSYTHNNGKRAFVVIDKKQAQLFLFTPQGKLKGQTPVLLGKAVGDTTAPGVGNLPLSKIPDDLKTTPAGRFIVERGLTNRGDDVFWIDYKAAVSMHRMHSVSADERRGERMASADNSDNRISNGCVNLPARFYDGVLKPTLMKQGAIVYVLPETTTPQQLFGSYDVPAANKRVQVATR
jgi:hypothetical protein